MPKVKPEFSRPFEAKRVSPKGNFEKLAAEAWECAALAKRLDVPSVQSLKAELHVTPWRGGGLKITGEITCELEQVSVVSLEAFPSRQRFTVERYFLPHAPVSEADDVDLIDNGCVDLGEIVAETLALELDPYPRKPGEVFEDRIENDEPMNNVRPFARLKDS